LHKILLKIKTTYIIVFFFDMSSKNCLPVVNMLLFSGRKMSPQRLFVFFARFLFIVPFGVREAEKT